MSIFDRMAEAAGRELGNYRDSVAARKREEQDSKVVAGQFSGYATDGRLIFRTPGGGSVLASSASGGGFRAGAIAQINQSTEQNAFADATPPAGVTQRIDIQRSPV